MSFIPENATDGNLNTRWRHGVNPTWLKLNLGSVRRITYVDIAWVYGNTNRVYHFNVHCSLNDIDYDVCVDNRDSVNQGVSGAGGTSYERYVFANGAMDAQYLKINVMGNNEDNFASIWEVVPGMFDEDLVGGVGGIGAIVVPDVFLNVSDMTASSDDGNNPASKAKDDNFTTYWRTTSGNPSWLKADLGQLKNVAYIQIAFYKGAAPYDGRIHTFNVEYSTDNSVFTSVLGDRQNNQTDGSPETFLFPSHVNARYIRVNIKGNSVNNHAGVYELDVFGNG
jgi:hypothetical protein